MADIIFVIPVRVYSESNLREHWRTCAKRTQGQRMAAKLMTAEALGWRKRGVGVVVTLTRVAPRVMDSDNLARAFKAIRDGVADGLGLDDGSPLTMWRYDQRRGKPKVHAVEVKIQRRAM